MDLIVKNLENENHIYLMDCNMRPLSIDVVTKIKTNEKIKEFILKYNISNVNLFDVIDFSKNPDYIIDRI